MRVSTAKTMANYERVLRIVILINGLLGLVLLFWPGLVAGDSLEHGGGASTWGRGTGLFLILLSLALLPAAIFAIANRYLALLAAAAQIVLGLFFAFSGAHLAWLLAVYLFVAAYLLFAALLSPALIWPGCWRSTCLLPLTCFSQLSGAGSSNI